MRQVKIKLRHPKFEEDTYKLLDLLSYLLIDKMATFDAPEDWKRSFGKDYLHVIHQTLKWAGQKPYNCYKNTFAGRPLQNKKESYNLFEDILSNKYNILTSDLEAAKDNCLEPSNLKRTYEAFHYLYASD